MLLFIFIIKIGKSQNCVLLITIQKFFHKKIALILPVPVLKKRIIKLRNRLCNRCLIRYDYQWNTLFCGIRNNIFRYFSHLRMFLNNQPCRLFIRKTVYIFFEIIIKFFIIFISKSRITHKKGTAPFCLFRNIAAI